MLRKRFFAQHIATATAIFALAACSSTPDETGKNANQGEQRIEKLQVVDCLLPGQTRSLGGKLYLTPRRPALITASECEIRGGEYVAYDRADYKTSLKVWLPSAEAGDSEAQANVGEIFERGLGSEPNYEMAIIWYEKAAEQGNQRALFNLGTLYEQGLGVEQNKLIAMNYYRKAWGLPEDSVVFQSAVDAEQEALQQQLKQQIAKKDAQINALQSQVASLNKSLIKEQNNTELEQQIQSLNELVAGLNQDNKAKKQQLASILDARNKRKIRTVVSKQDATFEVEAKDIIGNDINFGKYYALVIGIEDYDNVEKLDTPVNDSNEISKILADDYGFIVKKVTNADNVSVMEAINNLSQQLTENDNLLIFYAGHGVRLQNKNLESGYWLPVNADAPPRDTNWVSNEFVTRHLARLDAKRVLVVADSCYAGLLSSSPDMLMLGNNNKSAEFLKYKANKRSRLLLTSGGDQPVLDSATGQRHSIFAKAFIEALKNNEGILTGPELYQAVNQKVVKESKANNFEQKPEYKAIKGAGHEVGEFFFVKQGWFVGEAQRVRREAH